MIAGIDGAHGEITVSEGLHGAALTEAADVLSDAFADYPVAMTFTPDAVRRICDGDDVVLDACALARVADGRLLGVGLSALRGDTGRLAAMGVVRAAHNRGVGRRLGESVLDALHRRGARRVVLEALAVNAPALALYERRLGFVRHRRLVGFTRPPGGAPIPGSEWELACAAGGEPDSWQLARMVVAARAQSELVSVPAVIPEHHAVAALLREAGFAEAAIDQYELSRELSADARISPTPAR